MMNLRVAKQNYGKKIREKIAYDGSNKTLGESLNLAKSKEQFVLKVSMYCALILAIFGIGFGIYTKSSAVVFDGLVCLVSVAMGFLSVVTSRYIFKDDDDVFQYGYVRFEPMVNLFKSLVLFTICIYGFFGGIKSIVGGGYTLELGSVFIYTIFAFLVCVVIFIYTSFYSKILDSELIGVDRAEWLIDCVLYLGAIVAFGCVYAFDPKQEHYFSKYIDSILLVALSLILAFTPLKIMISSLKDLMMVAPKELDEKITQIVEDLSNEYGFKDYDTHVAKNGRFFMIEVNILSEGISVLEMDLIRDRIEKNLEIPSYRIWLLVSFTANPKWL